MSIPLLTPQKGSAVSQGVVGLASRIVCVLIFEATNGAHRFQVDRKTAEKIAVDMMRFFDVVGGGR